MNDGIGPLSGRPTPSTPPARPAGRPAPPPPLSLPGDAVFDPAGAPMREPEINLLPGALNKAVLSLPEHCFALVGEANDAGTALLDDEGEEVGAHLLGTQIGLEYAHEHFLLIANAPVLADRLAAVFQRLVVRSDFDLHVRRGALVVPDRAGWVLHEPQPFEGTHERLHFADGQLFIMGADGARQTLSVESELGVWLGSGRAKVVYALGEDYAVGVLCDPLETGLLDAEERALEILRSRQLPTVPILARIEVLGREAFVYPRMVASGIDILDPDGTSHGADAVRVLNERSLEDLVAIRDVLVRERIYADDFDVVFDRDGHAYCADPVDVEGVQLGREPSAESLDRLDRLIALARARVEARP